MNENKPETEGESRTSTGAPEVTEKKEPEVVSATELKNETRAPATASASASPRTHRNTNDEPDIHPGTNIIKLFALVIYKCL